MKKYFFSAIAIIAAGTAVAVASPNQALVYFSYQPTTFTQAQVANTANWKEAAQDINCVANDRACQIAVDAADLTGTPGARLLSAAAPSLLLTAIQGGDTGQYKPVYDDGPEIEIYNKD